MNIGLLSWCKILSLVLLCRLYLVACDHSSSTDDSNPQDAHTSTLYTRNRNNYDHSRRPPKVILVDRNKSEQRPRYTYHHRTRHHSGKRQRQIIDYRTINKPKMQFQNDDDLLHESTHRPRGDRGRYERGVRERVFRGVRESGHRGDRRDRGPLTPLERARKEYLKNKVLMELDLNNTHATYGFDVKIEGDKTTCKAIHPYLFCIVKRGDTILWKSKSGDYPYKVVCIIKGGQESCKVFFPDYEKDYPPARPVRVDVYKRVSGRQFGPEHWAGNLYYDTQAHTSPEMHGLSGQILSPPHIPTGEAQPTPHTSLEVNPDESTLPQDETVLDVDAVDGEQPEQMDDSAEPNDGEQPAEDTKDVEVVEGAKSELPGTAPAAQPASMSATIPTPAPGTMPGVMPGAIPRTMPAAYPGPYPGVMPGPFPRRYPSETERVNHVEMMPDFFNENLDPRSRSEYHPAFDNDLYHHSSRRHRSSRRDRYHDMAYPSHRRHHRSHHMDHIPDDTQFDGSSRHDKQAHGSREFRDYQPPVFQPIPEPTIPFTPKRADFKSHISPKDVVVQSDQSRQTGSGSDVDPKKPENLVLTFANKSNVYVVDGAHHTFALNQSGNETGHTDQNAANNLQQRIIFNGEDSNRISLDTGSVRISFPAQVIEGIPMPTGNQPGQNNAQPMSNATVNPSQPAQNSRPAGAASGNAASTTNANPTPQSSQRTSQPVSNQQPVSQQAPRPQAVSQQPVSQQPPRPQAVSHQAVSQQGTTSRQVSSQASDQARNSDGGDSRVEIRFADD